MIRNPLLTILQNRRFGGIKGLYSCCSANEYVIRAAMRRARARDTVVLIEATANQVNQDGGYTGMSPADFMRFVDRLAREEGLPRARVFCGGDHLGPLTWQELPEQDAMQKAHALVAAYAAAGFSKIHLDTSMRLGSDDPAKPLCDAVIARRGAELCRTAETAFRTYEKEHSDATAPVYVIGSEVPVPGGAQENEDSVVITSPDACKATITEFERTFAAEGLMEAWKRVVALVVQPGVEFADETVVEYNHSAASELMKCLKTRQNLVFEGHSTDYQPKECLRQMVQDGIAILKVGPALTFALREGLFALENIERELYAVRDFPPSHFRGVLENTMLKDNSQWAKYYHGTTIQKRYARAFSYSDRARYYLTNEKVQAALTALLHNLDTVGIPMALLSQYMPVQYTRVQTGELPLRAADLLIDRVGDRIDDYLYATLSEK